MALNIKHPDADRLARALARATGESLTEAVLIAIKQRLEREVGRGDSDAVRKNIRMIQRSF
ncbi:MAG TPA: type II toxin-antitoxin system VapB family antitoxin, partial [Longimicrobiaceae bacterium]|nr:type II toxin-antitoxin system VapB family antitoxin [Longimicrobiaceae bacterium]